jgi:hypothetical protein
MPGPKPRGGLSGPTADRLDEVLQLRDLVEQLEKAAEVPRGFGRD